MKDTRSRGVAVAAIVLVSACGASDSPHDVAAGGADSLTAATHPTPFAEPTIPSYDFTSPIAVFKLDNDLREISGLTVFDEKHLAAVEDEHGRFYLIDMASGEITEDHKFAGKDDYEGIELADGRLFALRSDGQVREIEDFDTDNPDSDKVKTPLGKACDAEGLAFDPDEGRLLIACKEHPGDGLKAQRAIYALDLVTMELSEEPVYSIPLDTIDAALDIPGSTLRRFLSPIADLEGFKPSALAVHPVTSQVYVLSSVLKVIAVLDREGRVVTVYPLDGDLLEQPEGLAFLQNGDLFISSEGDNKKARLVRYAYAPAEP